MTADTADPTRDIGLVSEGADSSPRVESAAREVRTAVVIVHGMGEQHPMDNLDAFVRTALRPHGSHGEPRWDYYYSRPAEITGSYEARRYLSPQLNTAQRPGGGPTEPLQGPAEIYEYRWSFLMTSNRFAGVMPMTMRLLLRRPSNVPEPLFGIWRLVWSVIVAIVLSVPTLFGGGYLLNTDVPGWIVGLIASAVILIFWFGLYRMLGKLLANRTTRPFIDVVRYLDTSPYSYEARRAIRGGLVDLLRALHDGRYSRIVVVAQGVGAFISYDALISLWAEIHQLHAALPDSQTPIRLAALSAVEEAADRLIADAGAVGALEEFQDSQFALWQDLRWQGNPWRITDFITVGTPMALADILLTRPGLLSGFKKSDRTHRRAQFDGLVRHGALVRCPPRPETLPVESTEQSPASYRWTNSGVREVLGSQSPFAVTRWTNVWFPVIRGELRGDWFGGALRPVFGPGIRDIAAQGNKPERFKRGSAHTEYFRHPEKADEGDVAWHIRKALALQTHAVLERLLAAPPPQPDTAEPVASRASSPSTEPTPRAASLAP
jgi:hypothetical protein